MKRLNSPHKIFHYWDTNSEVKNLQFVCRGPYKKFKKELYNHFQNAQNFVLANNMPRYVERNMIRVIYGIYLKLYRSFNTHDALESFKRFYDSRFENYYNNRYGDNPIMYTSVEMKEFQFTNSFAVYYAYQLRKKERQVLTEFFDLD